MFGPQIEVVRRECEMLQNEEPCTVILECGVLNL